MKLSFIADTHDYWKGALLEALQRGGLLVGLRVDAMATDPPSWKEEDWQLYAELLRVPRSCIVKHCVSLRRVRDREHYFQEIPKGGDLFLDPNTGVATGKEKPTKEHVSPTELASLLTSSNMVAVYQHRARGPLRDRLGTVVSAVRAKAPAGEYIEAFSYEATLVGMLFFSKDSGRIRDASNHFVAKLGPHARDRIHVW